MSEEKYIRFKQRRTDLQKVITLLNDALNIHQPDKIQEAGIIQLFEMSFELSWKTMKDYLEFNGFDVKSPRNTIKTANIENIINDGYIWLEILDTRNIVAHIYNDKIAVEAINKIKDNYIKLFIDLIDKLNTL